jgi:hypothetical protein
VNTASGIDRLTQHGTEPMQVAREPSSGKQAGTLSSSSSSSSSSLLNVDVVKE